MQENGRATLVGEKSFGKGIIQNLQELRQSAGVAVTIAKYETPLHRDINKVLLSNFSPNRFYAFKSVSKIRLASKLTKLWNVIMVPQKLPLLVA